MFIFKFINPLPSVHSFRKGTENYTGSSNQKLEEKAKLCHFLKICIIDLNVVSSF